MGILLVLFGHTEIPHKIVLWIYGFHMPLFFFVSGFFSKDGGFCNSLIKNCKKILLPWLFMFLCYLCIYVGINVLYSGDLSGLLSALKGKFNLLDEDSLWYPTIWFLVCLFFVKTIDTIVWYATKCDAMRLFVGGGLYTLSQYIKLPFFLDTAMAMFLFYEIGRIFHIKGWYKKSVHYCLPFIIIALYTAFIHTILPEVDVKHNEYPLYLPLMSIPMILAFFQLSQIIEIYTPSKFRNAFSHLGRSSLVLFGLHQPLWILLFPVASHIPLVWLSPLFMVLLTIPILLAIEKLITKYYPFLLGK